ncbi:hypothetical protein D3C87_517770 [compost metagenome]
MAKTYQNPVVMFDPKRWSIPTQLRFMKFNIFVNRILPERLLHVLNASKSSRDWRRKEAERIAKRKEINR